MESVTLKLNDKSYIEIKKFYASFFVEVKQKTIDFQAKQKDVSITGYKNAKKGNSVVFQGKNAKKEADKWVKKADKVNVATFDFDEEKVEAVKKAKAAKKAEPMKKETSKATKKEASKETKKAEPSKKPVKKTETKKKEESIKQGKKAAPLKKEAPKAVKKAPLKEDEIKNQPVKKNGWVDLDDQIGSDEVGTGDFLGPVIVVACYVKKNDIKLLNDLGVKDSKKLTDAKIREIAPILASKLEYSKLTLSNDKYNAMIITNENLNSLKAKLHNRALVNLVDKHPEVVGVYIDQFCTKEKFFSYLDDPEERKIRDVSFMTKGESLFPSVAAASVIARYAFLMEIDQLNAKYDTVIPLGAGAKVNDFARTFIKEHGIMEFNKIAKRNFANYKEVIKG